MLSDLLWRISIPFLHLIQFFDRRIPRHRGLKIKIYKLTNCRQLSETSKVSVTAWCSNAGAYDDTGSQWNGKIENAGKSAPRCTVKLYLPRKCDKFHINLMVIPNPEAEVVYCMAKEINLENLDAGIHYIEIFMSDIIEKVEGDGCHGVRSTRS